MDRFQNEPRPEPRCSNQTISSVASIAAREHRMAARRLRAAHKETDPLRSRDRCEAADRSEDEASSAAFWALDLARRAVGATQYAHRSSERDGGPGALLNAAILHDRAAEAWVAAGGAATDMLR